MDWRATNARLALLLLCSSLLVLAVAGVAPVALAQNGLSVTVAPQKINSGQTATLTAVVTGASATYTLLWYDNSGCSGTAVHSGTSNTFTTPPLTSTTTYCVIVSSAGGTASTTVIVTVNQVTSATSTTTSSSSNFPYLIALIAVILIAIIGAAAYYIPRRSRSTGSKKPDMSTPPTKPSEQTATSASQTGGEIVGKPPVGYHLKDKDSYGKPITDSDGKPHTVAERDGMGGLSVDPTDVLWWDTKHRVWVHQGWKPDPVNPDRIFNEKTGQNANWDDEDHQWIDSSTGQPIGYK